MKKTDINKVAEYFATRDEKHLEGVEIPATIKAIIEQFKEIPEPKSTLIDGATVTVQEGFNVVSGTVRESVLKASRWINNQIKK